MNDPDQSLMWSDGIGEDLPERLWRYDDPDAGGEGPGAEPGGTFVNMGFIMAALKRKAWLWCTLAVVGLLIGSAAYVKFPPAFSATTTVLVQDNPADLNPSDTMTTNATLAQSYQVGRAVVSQLGLRESVASFLAASTVTAVTSQIVTITVSARTSAEAVSRASAWAAEFLKFRANYLRAQQELLANQVNQQLSQAQARLATVSKQITNVSAQPATPAQKAKLANLEAESQAQSGIVLTALANVSSGQTTTTTMINGSQVLNPAAVVARGKSKGVVLYVGGGFIAGLALGMVIAIVGPITTDRLRRRDDVAAAIGAPVRLSLGRAKRDGNIRRAVTHLHSITPVSSQGSAGLAVVAVDNAALVAPMVVELAVAWAREGKRVVVADLADGALANRLGAKTPGVVPVSVQGVQLVAVVPGRDDVAPIGPAYRRVESQPPSDELLAACASADLVFTLTTLDPASSGEHLVTWATDAVAVVSTGRSSATRIHAVGEMVKLAGARLVSVILLGADKDDESFGTAPRPDSPASLGIL